MTKAVCRFDHTMTRSTSFRGVKLLSRTHSPSPSLTLALSPSLSIPHSLSLTNVGTPSHFVLLTFSLSPSALSLSRAHSLSPCVVLSHSTSLSPGCDSDALWLAPHRLPKWWTCLVLVSYWPTCLRVAQVQTWQRDLRCVVPPRLLDPWVPFPEP
jgi:hypothetical protein